MSLVDPLERPCDDAEDLDGDRPGLLGPEVEEDHAVIGLDHLDPQAVVGDDDLDLRLEVDRGVEFLQPLQDIGADLLESLPLHLA